MADGSKSTFYVSKQNTKHTYIGTPPHALHADIIAYSRRNQIKKKTTPLSAFLLWKCISRDNATISAFYTPRSRREIDTSRYEARHMYMARGLPGLVFLQDRLATRTYILFPFGSRPVFDLRLRTRGAICIYVYGNSDWITSQLCAMHTEHTCVTRHTHTRCVKCVLGIIAVWTRVRAR